MSSHTLALWLLGLMTLATLAAGTLPQSARLSPEAQVGWSSEWETTASWLDNLGLSQIIGSGWFTLLCVALVINILAGTLVAFTRKLAFYRGDLKPEYEYCGRGSLPEIPPFLGKNLQDVGVFTRVQGVLGLFGSVMFHLGVVVIVLAGFWRGAVDFTDYFELSEGELFSGQSAKFQRRKAPPEPLGAVLRLDRAEITVRDDKYLGEYRAHFSYRLSDGVVEQAIVQSNHPLRIGDYEVHPKHNFGYSAWFEQLKPDGTFSVLYVHFNAEAKEWNKPWSGEKEQMVYFDNTPLYYKMRLHNSIVPLFDLKVNRGEEVIFDSRLRPGDIADLGEYKLLFRGMVPWMTFSLALDRGEAPIFVGFVITLLGFLLHLLFRPRRIEWRVSGCGWEVRAWVRRGDYEFENKWHEWRTQQELKSV